MKKILIITAITLAVLGTACFVGALAAADFDLSRIGTEKYVTNTHEITDGFDNISIDLNTEDVTLALSQDGKCRVVCIDEERRPVSVSVVGGTLKITAYEREKWYDYINLTFVSRESVTVYLPETEYNALTIDVDTSDINVSGGLSFNTAEIESDTGDIRFEALVNGNVEISTDTGEISITDSVMTEVNIISDTGDIYIRNLNVTRLDISEDTGEITVIDLNAAKDIRIDTDTGDSELSDVNCESLLIEGDTGEIELKNVIATSRFNIENSTGDVEFDGCDAAEITVRTSTGDVSGTLNSEMVFIARSSTGDIDVPGTVNGGRCEITTSTGDIRITIK